MPTQSQRQILGAAGALRSMFQGRIEALKLRQDFISGMKTQEQEQEKLDINRIFADAQMLSAQTQAAKTDEALNDPVAQLKMAIAGPLLHKVNTVGVNGLSDRELQTFYGLLDIKPSAGKQPPEINDMSDLIGAYTAGSIGDEEFLKGVDLFENSQAGSLWNDTFLAILRAHPGATTKSLPKLSMGGQVTEFENKDVKMGLPEIVGDAVKETDRQINGGHVGQFSRHWREIIEGTYSPEADQIEEDIVKRLEAIESDPLTRFGLEKIGAGTEE